MLLLAALLVSGASSGADKTAPEYLREKHAGAAELQSGEVLPFLYPKLLQAATDCWVGRTREQVPAGTGGAVGGAAAVMTVASRDVFGDMSPERKTAYIVVRARSAMGLLESNFLQIDLETTATGGTRLAVFHKNNVKGQREFIDEVRQWLQGNTSFCTPKLFMQKKDR